MKKLYKLFYLKLFKPSSSSSLHHINFSLFRKLPNRKEVVNIILKAEIEKRWRGDLVGFFKVSQSI